MTEGVRVDSEVLFFSCPEHSGSSLDSQAAVIIDEQTVVMGDAVLPAVTGPQRLALTGVNDQVSVLLHYEASSWFVPSV